jgi:integrase
MGLPKRRAGRGETYYANIMVDGVNLRQCLNTDNYQQALHEQKKLVQKVWEGKIGSAVTSHREWARYSVSEALDVLQLERGEAGRSEATLRIGRERAKPLKKRLGTIKLVKIDANEIRKYQSWRRKQGAGNRTINMEVGLLRLLLKKVDRWKRIEDEVEIFEERHDLDLVRRVLTAEEKDRLFSTAHSDPNWYRALYVAVIAVNTTARKHEVLRARFRDLDLFSGVWRIPQSKTDAGRREIALNPEARAAFARMLEQADTLNEVQPDNFIFCACQNKVFDYRRPQKSVTTSWRKLTRAAGLKGFRIHDLRHQAITELSEAGVPESVITSMAGHVSRKMLAHYTHVRTGAREKAVAVLGGTGILDRDRPMTRRKQ